MVKWPKIAQVELLDEWTKIKQDWTVKLGTLDIQNGVLIVLTSTHLSVLIDTDTNLTTNTPSLIEDVASI
eukprot:c37989_g1_i1 orf=83-292(+)